MRGLSTSCLHRKVSDLRPGRRTPLTFISALAQYAGNDPRQSTTAWLDGYFGMGALVHELIPNYDCPHGAVFLPATTHAATGSMTNPRAICIFEMDSGKAMTRHRGYVRSETGVVKDFVLVVRSVTSVGTSSFLLPSSLY